MHINYPFQNILYKTLLFISVRLTLSLKNNKNSIKTLHASCYTQVKRYYKAQMPVFIRCVVELVMEYLEFGPSTIILQSRTLGNTSISGANGGPNKLSTLKSSVSPSSWIKCHAASRPIITIIMHCGCFRCILAVDVVFWATARLNLSVQAPPPTSRNSNAHARWVAFAFTSHLIFQSHINI